MQIPIYQINVNAGRREADPEAVQKLADSISKVGLLNPITVDQEYTLIAGLHRLEAAKHLGWPEIECTVKNLDGLLAELAEIDENLIRRKEIYEVLHPEIQQVIYALRDLFIRFFGKEVEALRAFFIEGGLRQC